MICGRDERRLAAATAALRRQACPGVRVHGFRCDVSNGHGGLRNYTLCGRVLKYTQKRADRMPRCASAPHMIAHMCTWVPLNRTHLWAKPALKQRETGPPQQ